MWAIGLNCIVDILCSVSPDVTLLMDEFESAGGRKLFVHILAGENYVFLFNLSYLIKYYLCCNSLYREGNFP